MKWPDLCERPGSCGSCEMWACGRVIGQTGNISPACSHGGLDGEGRQSAERSPEAV